MNLDILLATFWGLPCWLWLLLAGILPFILGWLLRSTYKGGDKENKTTYSSTSGEDPKYRILQDKINAYEKTDAELKYKIEQLELDLKKCRSRNQTIDMERLMYKEKLTALGALDGDTDTGKNITLAAGAVATDDQERNDTGIAYASLFTNDNLQIVEGIGPKVEKLLKAKGIANWSALAAKKPEELKTILADNKLQMINPDSWPRQAELAATGKWAELVEYQKFLDTGVATSGDFDTPSKIEQMAIKLLGFSQNPEDLKVIEGIGPKIEIILKEGGIKTWADLAASSVERLNELLTAAGDRYNLANPGTWPRQAEMAAKCQWGKLKEYQDYLDKGVDPNQK